MRKKNGFVFLETIVVVSVLSFTLMLLFASYSYILKKARVRNTMDTMDTIYKTYYIKELMDSYKPDGLSNVGVLYYIQNHLAESGLECSKMGAYNSYVCDLSGDTYAGDLSSVKSSFNVEKLYYLNPHEVLSSASKDDWLNAFDATTIDYILNLGESTDNMVLIVKYKETYNKTDGSYEIYHSSIEVKS